MVVAHHASNQIAATQSHLEFGFGVSGVDLFFVISGFIMAVTSTDMSPIEFVKRRIVRVVPLYWLLTLSMICIALVAPSLFKTLRFSAGTVVESLLFVPHSSLSFPGMAWPVLVPGWTLNFEMFFYAMFSLSLFLPVRSRTPALVAAFAMLIVVGFLFGPFDSPVFSTYTSPLLAEFVSGVLIGHLWLRGLVRLTASTSSLAIVCGAGLLVLRNDPPFMQFNPMLGAVLVVVGSLHSSIGHWHNRTLRALGDSSYSIYLTHIFTLGALREVWVKTAHADDSATSAWLFMITSLLICAVAGWFTYRWLEQPLLRWFSARWFSRSV